ncbi:MAG: RES family NAD+ phosphorylase [Chitinophagaceae bacterium]|nr:RES family NAD+ phosphorylase [Chitinophagaceae bacterium]
MIVYRIVDSRFSEDLSGEGARLYGGRWNSKGISALYCSEHISLAALENVVYLNDQLIVRDFHLMHIEIPDQAIHTIDPKALKKGWHQDVEYTRWLGTQFIDQKGFILKIPSAIIQEEFNFLINTEHVLNSSLKIVHQQVFMFDQRLFKST